MHRLNQMLRSGLSLLLVLSLCVGAVAFADTVYPYEVTTIDSVNMRSQPKNNAIVLERISKGTVVVVIGESGDYYEISYNGRTGYAMKTYVSGAATATVSGVATVSARTSVSSYPYNTTTSQKVNMRKRASTTSDLVDRLDAGEAITVTGVEGDFLKITYNGREGYVMAAYVNVMTVSGSQTDSSGGSSAYTVLQNGSQGDNVYALQLALIEMGYLSGTADGVFGGGTETAVRNLQSNNELPQTGVVDPNLQALVYEGKPVNEKKQKVALDTLSPLNGAIIRINNVGKAVEAAATRLKELEYYTGAIGLTYTKDMQTATKAFQKKNGLTNDGAIGEKTRTLLFSDNAIAQSSDATPAPTATPTVYEMPASQVKRSSIGKDAKLVQQRLKDLGYFTSTIDGVFGTKSVAALTAFQKANNIKTDGICGSGTAKILFSDAAIPAQANATTAPVETAEPTATLPIITKDNYVLITLGTKNEAVLNLQKRLTSLGYYNARNDGEYLTDDMAAVQAFQTKNGLKVDGKAGYDTQVRLYSDSAVGPDGINTTFATLRQGASGNAVKEMQQRLIDLNYLAGSADGKYGAITAQAIANFQRANGLVRDGIAGPRTLTLLYAQNSVAAPEPTTAPTTNATQTVRQGDVNSVVKTMQKRLIELGYLSGTADGIFGSQTLSAVKAFQRKNGLKSDGVTGANTWAVLNNSSALKADETATNTPNIDNNTSSSSKPRASNVIYANWYTSIKSKAKQYPYATVYDFATGLSWQVHMFSLGAHADAEPLTAQDTANMLKAFGGKTTWNPKAVWVIFGDGSVYMASTHDYPHSPQHRKDNNFDGHLCIHFPRTQSQVESIGPYATSHQTAIDAGWAKTQSMK